MSGISDVRSEGDERWTICIHTTFAGNQDDAGHIATLMERLAQRRGCCDTFIEILAQEANR